MVSSEITNMKQILYSVWLPVWVRWANAAYLGLTTANQQKDKVLLAGLHTSINFRQENMTLLQLYSFENFRVTK